jgi:hypothetical protein
MAYPRGALLEGSGMPEISAQISFFWHSKRKLPIFIHTTVCKEFRQLQTARFSGDAPAPRKNGHN